MGNATRPRGCCGRSIISRLPRLVVGLVSVTLLLPAAGPAKSQPPERVSINVAALITAEPATQVPFPIRVGPASSIPRNSFVRMRGLPRMASLSEGHTIAPGAWAVPLDALPALKIVLPATAAGKADIQVTLVAVDGSVLVEAKTTLVIQASPPGGTQPRPGASAMILAPGAAPAPVERAGPAGPIAPPALSAEDRERVLKLLKDGDQQMAQGNIAAARVVYELAADAGFAQAAMALAGTYDAAELARLGVRGIQPNAQEAKRWYERARQLGSSDAETRLQRLGAK